MATKDARNCFGGDYLDKFDPILYLESYVNNDSRAKHILRCFHEAFQGLPANQSVLDYGSGPSLLTAMVAAPKASEIILSDYSSKNREQLRKWLERGPTAFDWTPHITFLVSELEGKGVKAVSEREELVRAIVRDVVTCDMAQDPLIESSYGRVYDVVMSSLVLDTLPRTSQEFTDVLCRVGRLVKKGGSLFLYFAENVPLYKVGDITFECVSVNSDMVERAMEIAGISEI